MRNHALIVDDEESIRKLVKSRLEREGYQVSVASNAIEAEQVLAQNSDLQVMVTDLRMPGKDGFELMATTQSKYPTLRTIVITGHGEKDVAVRALRSGAQDYLEKPFDMDELTHAVGRCVNEYRMAQENRDLVGRLEARVERVEGKTEDQFWFVSKDPSMGKVNEWLSILRREAMRGDAEEPTVLVLGESGTGKEGIARMVHTGSRRGRGPWVAVNCANFNEQLLESELFGHERGAFTGANTMKRGLFEIAKGGTLFLDELGEMDVKLQAKLLRVLQEKTFRRVGGAVDLTTDVRVIAATNVNLSQKVSQGAFREDLYHRINRVMIEIPALRARTQDVVAMAKTFAERAYQSRGKAFGGFTPDAENALQSYNWPGNVRELLNVIERTALVTLGNGSVGTKDLGISFSRNGGTANGSGTTFGGGAGAGLALVEPVSGDGYMDLKKRWSNSFEREYLVSTLKKHEGNVSAAAREAKLDRSNFLRLLRRHGVKAQEFRVPGSPQMDDSNDSQAA
jgi:DNA-binding NtrC family response regulator